MNVMALDTGNHHTERIVWKFHGFSVFEEIDIFIECNITPSQIHKTEK